MKANKKTKIKVFEKVTEYEGCLGKTILEVLFYASIIVLTLCNNHFIKAYAPEPYLSYHLGLNFINAVFALVAFVLFILNFIELTSILGTKRVVYKEVVL